MFQTAVSKQVEEGKDVATSVQSSVFNLSIMIATWVGGMFLSASPASGVRHIVYMSLAFFIVAMIIALLAKRTLSASSAMSADHEGENHEEVHERPDLSTA